MSTCREPLSAKNATLLHKRGDADDDENDDDDDDDALAVNKVALCGENPLLTAVQPHFSTSCHRKIEPAR